MGVIHRRWRLTGAGAAAAALTGCASFSGVPKPVMTPGYVVGIATKPPYGLRDAADVIAQATPVTKTYRDAFVAVQLAAIDARYQEFRGRLSMQAKGANFGLETAVLALTAGGAIAGERLANILSAGGAGLTGTKAALSKEVYFERTLSALLTSMDTRRIEAKAPITAGLKRSVDDYPLAQAIADLFAYQNSASLDGAIVRITAAAAVENAAAEEKYENVTDTCVPEPGIRADWAKLRAGLNALDPATDEAKLDLVSGIVGTSTAPPFAEQKTLVVRKVAAAYCSRAEVQALIAQITAEAKVTFP